MSRNHLIFVYGTLKEGYRNHTRFLVNQPRVGTGRTNRRFHVTCVGFPIAYERGPHPLQVDGEVYLVDDKILVSLDRLEGVPHLYQRTTVKINLDEGYQLNVWMYTKRPRLTDPMQGGPCPIVGGAYCWSHD
jgi:gamma-glutamylaminecyclotransferase